MNLFYRAALLACGIVLASPAHAHAPIMGIGGVPGGMLHALLIPEHGASLVALGLVLGRQERTARRSGLLIFVAALVGGLVATGFGVTPALATDALLIAMGVLGLLIALAWGPPLLAWILAAVAGLTFALDSVPEVTSTDEIVRMLIGSGIGAALVLVIVAEACVFLRGNAPRIVMRVLGSWIAASAILVLALRIATRFATA
jgi:urease accessory protein